MDLLKKYFSLKTSTLLILILCGNLIISWLSRVLLIDDIVFYNTYSEQLTYDRAMTLFENSRKLIWIVYVILPIILLIKFILISTVIFVGFFVLGESERITFSKIFGVVVGCDVVFIISGLSKFLWFYFFAGNYDLNELAFFYPLALSNIFTLSEIDKIWIFPLQSFNLFQFAYILLLSLGLSIRSGVPKVLADKTVLISYLPGLILAISLIMFISIGKTA